MKQSRNELTTRLEAGGVCIQGEDWGDINVARIRFPAGADAGPLLEGLPNDLCQCPHWGTVMKGSIHVTYADGSEETVHAGEVYYWPPATPSGSTKTTKPSSSAQAARWANL